LSNPNELYRGPNFNWLEFNGYSGHTSWPVGGTTVLTAFVLYISTLTTLIMYFGSGTTGSVLVSGDGGYTALDLSNGASPRFFATVQLCLSQLHFRSLLVSYFPPTLLTIFFRRKTWAVGVQATCRILLEIVKQLIG
jgi:hypothetical protein